MILLYATLYEIVYQMVGLLRPFVKPIDDFFRQRLSSVEKLQKVPLNHNDKVIWIHCASLGEFEQIRPLLLRLKSDVPNVKRMITFFSASGYEIHKDSPLAEGIYYLPFDRKKDIINFLNQVQPQALLLVKYEFWPALLYWTKQREIPIFSVSSNFRKNQRFFSYWSFGTRRLLHYVDHFFVLNERSKSLLNTLGISQVTVSKDTRFDRVVDNCKTKKDLPLIEHFLAEKKAFVLGSTWPEDHELLSLDSKTEYALKWIIAPHKVDEKSIRQLTAKLKVPYAKWSTYSKATDQNKSVFILDCIGVLSHVYAYASLAYVGGGMGNKGLHNILEAAVYGLPILIGKNYKNFPEAVDLVAAGGIKSVENATAFTASFQTILHDDRLCNQMGEVNRKYIFSRQGATDHIISYLKEWLDL